MEAKIIIKKGESKIILLPENTFEQRIIEDLYNDKNTYNLNIYPVADYKMCSWDNHRLIIDIKEIQCDT